MNSHATQPEDNTCYPPRSMANLLNQLRSANPSAIPPPQDHHDNTLSLAAAVSGTATSATIRSLPPIHTHPNGNTTHAASMGLTSNTNSRLRSHLNARSEATRVNQRVLEIMEESLRIIDGMDYDEADLFSTSEEDKPEREHQ